MDFSQIDEVTGNFPGWQYIPIILALVNIIISLALFFVYRARLKKKKYSYVNVMILGLVLFALGLSLYFFYYYFNIVDGDTVYLMLVHFIFSARSFARISLPAVIVCIAVLVISGAILPFKEGFHVENFFGMILAAVIIVGLFITYLLENSGAVLIPNAIRNMWYVGYCYLVAQLISVVIVAVMYGIHTPDYNKDYVIILGCKVRNDGTLYPIIKGRVDRAIRFVQKQEEATGKKAVYMPSGGKGADETCSEGEAMKRYLIENGIPEKQIVEETESTTTYENLRNSKEIINDDTKNVAFSTTDFHVMRGGMIASNLNWDIDGMGSPTVMYYWPNALAREFIAMLARTWKLQIAVGAVLMIVASGLTYLIEIM